MAKTFLVIEDNAGDAMLIKRAFKSLESCSALVCRNVSEAKAYILGAGMYRDRQQYPFPNAVICDLQLGEESGVDFLKWVKSDQNFSALPVIILTGAPESKEALAAKKLGAIDVLRKPSAFEDLKRMLNDLAAKLCG